MSPAVKYGLTNACLWFAVVGSSLAVVWSTHECRELIGELMALQVAENDLKVEHGQYLLQEGTLASPARVEQDATRRLGMRIPELSEIQVIR